MPLTRPSAFILQLFAYRRTLIEAVIPARPDLDHFERIRSRSSRAKKKRKKGRGCRGGWKGGGEEGTRIWPLQLEERGKAEVANPCKEPLYFLKEVLRAPDALPPPGP